MLILVYDSVVAGPSLDPDTPDIVMLLLPVVRGPSVVAESGPVKVTSVTEVVPINPSVVVVFSVSSGEEVVVVGKPSVLSELGSVVLGTSVLTLVFNTVVSYPSLVPDAPDVVNWLISVVEGMHPANSG